MISSSLNIILLKSRCDRIKIFGYTFAYQTRLLFVDPKRSFITFVSINALCSSISKQILSITDIIISMLYNKMNSGTMCNSGMNYIDTLYKALFVCIVLF